jgi:hypothetical protein
MRDVDDDATLLWSQTGNLSRLTKHQQNDGLVV